MNYFKKNMKALETYIPELYGDIAPLEKNSGVLEIRTASSGDATAAYKGKLLHSAYDPQGEAERLLKASVKPDTGICVIEGFGLGYYIQAALKLSESLNIIVIDNSPERFMAALEARDLTDIFASERIIFLIGSRENAVSAALGSIPPGDTVIVRNRNLFIIEEDYFKKTESYIHRFISRKLVNSATLKKFGQIWIRNLIRNLSVVPEAEDIASIENIFKDMPVLLLAAGPSLDMLLPHIKNLKKRFIIVAVDTVMRALVSMDIYPDFLVVIDPQYWNARHIDRVDMSRTILVSESSTYPAVFRRGHSILFFSGSLFPLGQFLEEFTGYRKKLGAGGSVSTSAWDFAHTITSGTVYCSGLDLGFPGKETHYKGSLFEERAHFLSKRTDPSETAAFRALNDASPFPEKNNTGGRTLTDKRLIVYKQWFEEKAEQNPERRTKNLSPGGISISGFDYCDINSLMSFPEIRETVEEYKKKFPRRSIKKKKDVTSALFSGIDVLETELSALSSLAERSIKLIDTYKSGSGKYSIGEVLKRLDANDREILKLESKKITSFLIQPVLEEVTKDNPDSEDSLDRSRRLYSEIKRSCDFHLDLLKLYVKNYKVSAE